MDWPTLAGASLGCVVAYLLATRNRNPHWTEAQNERVARYRWWGAAAVAIGIFALTAAPEHLQPWLLTALIAGLVAYFWRLYHRGKLDQASRNVVTLLTLVFALFLAGIFLSGTVGLVVFGAGFALLVVGGRVLRRQHR